MLGPCIYGRQAGKGRGEEPGRAEHWQGNDTPTAPGPSRQALSCTGQLRTLVRAGTTSIHLRHPASAAPAALLRLLAHSRAKESSPWDAGTPRDGTDRVTRSALPCEARPAAPGAPAVGKPLI